MGVIRVLVVDDHMTFAEAVAAMVSAESDMQCVATADSPFAARVQVGKLHPDVAVIDVDLAGEDGIGLAAQLRKEHGIQTVVITGHEDPAVACAAVRAGASAVLTKSGPVAELINAIRGSIRGETYIPPWLLTGVLRQLVSPTSGMSAAELALSTLTQRESEVLNCMVAGFDQANTAKRLYISGNTVRTHVRKVLAKLGAHSSLEAVAIAVGASAGSAVWMRSGAEGQPTGPPPREVSRTG
jgi:DNA-binding NarL/FixJ family response regulator